MSLNDVITLPTRSGIELEVRPAREDDEAALTAFFERVEDEDRRFRFFAAADKVSAQQIAPLVHADQFRTESWIGFDKASGEIVSSGVLASDADRDTAEVAISVAGAYKGKGIGWAMLDFLGKQAEAQGCRRVMSIESRENSAAIEVERDKGFTPEPFDGDPTLVVLSKAFR
ncbi:MULTISPECIES: GNAT family N-acetyltransferase [Sphingomonadaceae]|uniref:GNAT family N-acetyltransferase n=1 Tax=Novosphingobium clariflavum TaxID=2029884 RepID=A0ABV6S7L2_9SPHN|nr:MULTISPECIES: GNAT family N-acetyltransferase [Sphingomonadaceae]QDK32533.1 GNAT family N-acetyltransferase [Sphingomonas sp. IC081]QSR18559.1 GNAT family N-acetyltransferase [Novosphingobium sp. KA1]